MLNKSVSLAFIVALAASTLPGLAHAHNEVEKAMSRIQASHWLSISGLVLSSGFILVLLFR
jgi:hypothetical protein